MSMNRARLGGFPRPKHGWAERFFVAVVVLVLAAGGTSFGLGVEGKHASRTLYYSTAPAPRDYAGPVPALLALSDPAPSPPVEEVHAAPVKDAEPRPATAAEMPRLASTAVSASPALGTRVATPALTANPEPPTAARPNVGDPIARAKNTIADCQERFKNVHDYTCTFVKRERFDGRLGGQHVMAMKARALPFSVYFKFQKPNRGREAIYVSGRHGDRVLAHDVGIGKFLAGTMKLDPTGSMAMEENRHPVTEAGIGSLIETVARHWSTELTPAESKIVFHPNVQVGGRPCTVIESAHPRRDPSFMFHMVKLYVDHEHGLPIRFEAYDWPKHPGAAPELIEEYTYLNLRTNVGLRDSDFDPANTQYSFGRF